MMFYKLFWYDLKNGFRSTWRRYGAALALFCIMFLSFCMVITGYNVKAKPEVEIPINMGNALMYAFGGMAEFIPDGSNQFKFPTFWMLTYLLLAYTTLYYPFDDLSEFGQNILIRSRSRGMWWFSKCVWNFLSVIAFFLLAWAVFALGCLIAGGSLSMELHPEILTPLSNVVLDYEAPATLIPQTLLLPLLVMIGLNLLQMTLSLFIKPFYSFMAIAAILLLSAYYLSPFCIGNYAMPLRSHLLVSNGVGLNTGILISSILIVASVVIGGLVFRKRDILKGEG